MRTSRKAIDAAAGKRSYACNTFTGHGKAHQPPLHMADVERNWFRRVMAQADTPPLYWSGDVEDADWAGAVADPAVVADAWRAWREEVAFAEQVVAGSPDLAVRSPMQDGTTVALREVILHMVEEYARHLGHADLLRERIDGRVGQ
jgi:uncharacterized damage-inducible protein DinB